ncbi:MAG TPA: hypothetical protein VH277_05275, partial [Gemmatimonadaceae bacterium]|nr:hypothetical protein [Gemmatimonadaceae bacterium]
VANARRVLAGLAALGFGFAAELSPELARAQNRGRRRRNEMVRSSYDERSRKHMLAVVPAAACMVPEPYA